MLCPKCAKETSIGSNADKCPHCGAQMTMAMPTSSPEPTNKIISWDNKGPVFTRLINTWKESMFHPIRFFSQTPTNTGIGKPLLYSIILNFISTVFGAIWLSMYTALHIPFFEFKMEQIPFLQNIPLYQILGIWIIISPLLMIIMTFITSGIYHLCLMVVDGNKKGFEATFRSCVYGWASPSLLNIIPFCGGHIGWIWGIVLTIIGFRETHKISTGKAVLAYFIPMIIVACLAVLAAIIIPNLIAAR